MNGKRSKQEGAGSGPGVLSILGEGRYFNSIPPVSTVVAMDSSEGEEVCSMSLIPNTGSAAILTHSNIDDRN